MILPAMDREKAIEALDVLTETGYRRPSDALRPKIAEALGADVRDLFPYEVAA